MAMRISSGGLLSPSTEIPNSSKIHRLSSQNQMVSQRLARENFYKQLQLSTPGFKQPHHSSETGTRLEEIRAPRSYSVSVKRYQDHQSREQAGALDQLNQVFKGLRHELDLKDQSSTLLSSQLEDLRILCINTQMSFSPLSPIFMNPNQNCLSFDQRLILPDPAEKPGLLGRVTTSLVAIGTLCSLNMLGPQLLSHVLGLKKAFNPTINGNEDQIRRLSKDSLGDGVDCL
ncbi:hypothetical protein BY996DRAFT_8444742 [Phakopsora pachyrhizi]|nr:hypothetical protein BY996DRAFT_8444742 [Phakopsora pachyrhizi]